MSFKFHKQYRLKGFDYTSNRAYFVTIVTKYREHFFGEISNNEMFGTDIYFYVEENIKRIKEKIQSAIIDEYIIMPNHIHLIILLKNEEKSNEIPKGIQPLISKSLSSFVNRFKGNIKRWCNENGFETFEWQDKFNDRIIRNEQEYFAIKNYIKNNIKNWNDDDENVHSFFK